MAHHKLANLNLEQIGGSGLVCFFLGGGGVGGVGSWEGYWGERLHHCVTYEWLRLHFASHGIVISI